MVGGPGLFSGRPLSRLVRHPQQPHACATTRPTAPSASSASRPTTPTATPSTGRAGWSPASISAGASRRTEFDGSITVLADKWQGKRLNSPNDVVVKSDGSIWFTDPAYGIDCDYEGDARRQRDRRLLRLPHRSAHRRHVEASSPTTSSSPNGLAFSPDETKLYIVDTGAHHCRERPAPHPRLRRRQDGGTLHGGEVFATCTAACSTASASTRTAASGPQPPTACTATTRTGR